MSSNYLIIGGGTSVRDLDIPDLVSKYKLITVGTNSSALVANTDILITADRLWTKQKEYEWSVFPGERIICLPANVLSTVPKFPGVIYKERVARPCLSDKPDVLFGHNTGYVALNEVYQRKPDTILLAGFDFYGVKGNYHWHGGYHWSSAPRNSLYESWASYFQTTLSQLKKQGIMVLNLNLKSNINAFDKVEAHELDRLLRGRGGY